MEIKKNNLRERAEGLPVVTQEMWSEVLEHNRDIVEEFLDANKQLAKSTIKQYTSALHQFFWFVKVKLKNKPLYNITKRNFVAYFSYLQSYELSSSALKFKKSAVSTLCNYIENIVAEDEEDYKTFRNFTKAISDIPKNSVYKKVKITEEEYRLMLDYLTQNGKYMEALWVAVSYNSGARKNEVRMFKTEIANYEKQEGKTYIETHVIFGKGRGGGKPNVYMLNDEVMEYMKLWIEKRDYDHEYLFTTKYNGEWKQISKDWANYLCTNILSPLCGRRINPHLFKASCVTHLLEKGVDMKVVSKYIAHHESTATTDIYDLRDDEEAKNGIFL